NACAALVVAGCANYSEVKERKPEFEPTPHRTGPLAATQAAIMQSVKCADQRPLEAMHGYLSAAYNALAVLRTDPSHPEALRDYNFAVARAFTLIRDAQLDPWSAPLAVPGPDGGYQLAHRPDPRSQGNPALYEFQPADEIEVKGTYVTERTLRPGLGAPLVVRGKRVNDFRNKDFATRRLYYGVTALLRFEGRKAVLEFEDPLATETVTIEGRNYPLAADFTAPLAVMLAEANPRKVELLRLLRPRNYAETARIARLQPYDPNKTVVLVIHGLMDSEATWTPMINVLRGDPEIRKNYQFWFFSYPSGDAYPYSAAILRRELDAIHQHFPITKPMVMIGHSMGGCISRLLLTDTGDQLWNQLLSVHPDELKLSSADRELIKECLIFRHRKEVGRVIFIAAPLKGSDLASDWVGRLGSKLIRMPGRLLHIGDEVASALRRGATDLQVRGVPSSVDTLAPNNRFVKAINTIPLAPGITYHTIMGTRGKGGPPDCSDGVVPYWSSHMEGAKSEKLVPSGHSAHQHPEAIEEVKRILRAHRRR
ncbi:MAG: alpha/beta fold hydrolase, partial [Akkermansiaceae bacterium]|nr:alpha/beta fold hydrolase [Akkermansiaceae bacterium]